MKSCRYLCLHFLTQVVGAISLTSDFLTSKSNQSIFVLKCAGLNLVKFGSSQFTNILCSQTTYAQRHKQQENTMSQPLFHWRQARKNLQTQTDRQTDRQREWQGSRPVVSETGTNDLGSVVIPPIITYKSPLVMIIQHSHKTNTCVWTCFCRQQLYMMTPTHTYTHTQTHICWHVPCFTSLPIISYLISALKTHYGISNWPMLSNSWSLGNIALYKYVCWLIEVPQQPKRRYCNGYDVVDGPPVYTGLVPGSYPKTRRVFSGTSA